MRILPDFALWIILLSVPNIGRSASPCADRTLTPVVTENENAPPRIAALRDFLEEAHRVGKSPHELVRSDDQYVLNIRYLSHDEKMFMVLMSRAIADGSLQRVNAGSIVGPKVLIMLDRIRKNPKGHLFEVTGKVNPYKIMMDARKEQLEIPENMRGTAFWWSERETAEFNTAMAGIGFPSAESAPDPMVFLQASNSRRDN